MAQRRHQTIKKPDRTGSKLENTWAQVGRPTWSTQLHYRYVYIANKLPALLFLELFMRAKTFTGLDIPSSTLVAFVAVLVASSRNSEELIPNSASPYLAAYTLQSCNEQQGRKSRHP